VHGRRPDRCKVRWLLYPGRQPVTAASIANGGTFLGTLCFFWRARLLLVEMAGADTVSAVPGPGAATRGG
jgi:hypothetical protein